MSNAELGQTISHIAIAGKGILAADESTGTIAKRFATIQTECTEKTRRDYREMLFTAPDLGNYINGVILYEETLMQKAANGTPLPELLLKQGILPGIKVDKGLTLLPNTDKENITQGLDNLADRLATYKELGAKFAKWRAVFNISAVKPSQLAVEANAHALAQYAAICQQAGIVPIVEPEVLMDGDHNIERCAEVTEYVLRSVFQALAQHKVSLEGIILKPNMVTPGADHQVQASIEAVASATIKVLLRTVPAAVPTVNFLSGGQSPELSTAHLNAMNRLYPKLPWVLSFSYGRALQAPSLSAWHGQRANLDKAKQALTKRAKLNSAASFGRYDAAMEADH